MKILYDHQIFNLQRYGGISRYFCELMNEFTKMDDISFEISGTYTDNYYLDNAPFYETKKFMGNQSFKGKKTAQLFLNGYISKKKIIKGDYDIFHPTFYSDYYLNSEIDKPMVFTLVDMMDELFQTGEKRQQNVIINKKLMAGRASKILTISESSKNDIVNILHINPEKIDVIYLGFNNSVIKSWNKDPLPNSYILFVGNRTWYKNFNLFFKSIIPLLHEIPDLKLICAGGGRFTQDETDEIAKNSLNKKVLQYDVSDAELYYLYSSAVCFVFPSLYEGFGIPVLEAFSNDCPAILSNKSSLPEIGGNGALYFDPESEDSIRQCVLKVLNDDDCRNTLIEKGKKRLGLFSWKKCAQETYSFYKNVLGL